MISFKKSAIQVSGLMVIGLAFALAGCGSGTSDTGGTTATTTTTTGGAGNASAELSGSGSTFVNPAMSKWIDEYKKSNGVTITYNANGSGHGISDYEAGLVDFAATDAPASADDLKKMPPTIQVPAVCGAVAIAYNLKGVTSLKLSPDAVAGIFLGTIKNWNDPAITKDNAGAALPNKPIAVAHRSDSSGTSFILTNYLSAVSPAWKSGYGVSKTPDWPVGSGGKGSDGVAAIVKQTDGSIGYFDLAYAITNGISTAQLKNVAGEFVAPSVDSAAAAATGKIADLKKDPTITIVNSSAKGAYPIVGFTYVLVNTAPKDAAKGKALVDFLNWAIDAGQPLIKDLQYAPLPKDLVDMNKTALGTVSSK